MNLSGDSVRAAMAFHKIEAADVIVLHDELDLPPGVVRAKTGGGHAGHNGLRSIAAHIGPDFKRVRIGIGHPGDKRLVSNYVLGDFAKADAAWLEPLLDRMAKAAPDLAAGDLARFAGAVNPPPEPKPSRRQESPSNDASSAPAPAETPEAAPEPEPGPLQRLIAKFR
jgi:PTH1 family peptidyl-tRNA hydrolase